MDIENEVKKCEESCAVFTVDHIKSELKISNVSRLKNTQVDWLKKHKDEIFIFLCKKQKLLVEIKKVFHDLDLPWNDEDFTFLNMSELEVELEKALPLLEDEELLREVEKVRQARKVVQTSDNPQTLSGRGSDPKTGLLGVWTTTHSHGTPKNEMWR